ncbi:hypothetical protein DPMN_133170 [Dreissena polymorpha]|uniref:Uncharacterized protein n=1 Tax=Dreissena polymorpha TaxID=45954 RepID=A0A9D4FTU2_DREPO|nr:hypothetical protein DPMN_133170 [Dreissena polymorpha]
MMQRFGKKTILYGLIVAMALLSLAWVIITVYWLRVRSVNQEPKPTQLCTDCEYLSTIYDTENINRQVEKLRTSHTAKCCAGIEEILNLALQKETSRKVYGPHMVCVLFLSVTEAVYNLCDSYKDQKPFVKAVGVLEVKRIGELFKLLWNEHGATIEGPSTQHITHITDEGEIFIRSAGHYRSAFNRVHDRWCRNCMTDSETALNTRPVVSRGSVSLPSCREDRCLCRLHGIEHPGQTDTFRSLSETELEPRNHRSRWCRNWSIALPELRSNWFTSPAEVTGHQKLHSMTDSETALTIRPVVSRGSVSLPVITPLHGIEHPGQTDTFRSLSMTELEPRNHRSRLHGIEHPGQTDTFRSLSETELEPRNHRSRIESDALYGV